MEQIAALLVPVLLLASMLWLFQTFTRTAGYPAGYLLGFAVYWIGWCLLVPVLLLGGVRPLLDLFHPFPSFFSLPWQAHLALWWPLSFPLFFMFIPRLRRANPKILLVSLLLGIIIGVTEEILWRGVYMALFPKTLWLSLFYPSLMFALWHLAPQRVLPNRLPGGALSFVSYALALGLTYGASVHLTGSIAWATIAHILHDTLGLGGLAYASWLGVAPEA